jgi:hypothetical protein
VHSNRCLCCEAVCSASCQCQLLMLMVYKRGRHRQEPSRAGTSAGSSDDLVQGADHNHRMESSEMCSLIAIVEYGNAWRWNEQHWLHMYIREWQCESTHMALNVEHQRFNAVTLFAAIKCISHCLG